MKVEREYLFDEDRDRVWAKLFELETLATCIPGCERLEQTGDHEYAGAGTVGVSVVKGRFEGTVSLVDIDQPRSLKMRAQGKGGPGFGSAQGVITLEERETGTLVRVDGEGDVGGMLARVGQRALLPVARTLMDRFFTCLGGRAA